MAEVCTFLFILMKRILLILLWGLLPLLSFSQDIIITSEGEVIEAFNLFEKDNSIFYSLSISQDSVFQRIDKDRLLMIKYKDGKKVYFNKLELEDNQHIDTTSTFIQVDSATKVPFTTRRRQVTHAEAVKRSKVFYPYIELQYRHMFYGTDIDNELSQLYAPALALRTQYIGKKNWFIEYIFGLQYAFGHEKEENGNAINVKNFSIIESFHVGPNIRISNHQSFSFYGGFGLRTSLMWNIGGVDMQNFVVAGDWRRFIWAFEAGAFYIHKKAIIGSSFGLDITAQERNTDLRSIYFCINIGYEI